MKKLCKVVYSVEYKTYLELEVPENTTEIIDENNMFFVDIFNNNTDKLFNVDMPEDRNSEYVTGSFNVVAFIPTLEQ